MGQDEQFKKLYRLEQLEKLAKLAGFDAVEDAITAAAIAKQKPIVAWMHDGENRFDVVHNVIRQNWVNAKEDLLEHYTIPLVLKETK